MHEHTTSQRPPGAIYQHWPSHIIAPLLMTVAIFCACLFGIFTRPVGFLATLWPANAIMLGFLIRRPETANAYGWIGASVAFVSADILTGSSFDKAMILNSGNIISVSTAYAVYRRTHLDAGDLQNPEAIFHLVLASVAGGLAAGIVGGIFNPLLFDREAFSGFIFWFVTEVVNYITLMPAILSAPSLATIIHNRDQIFAFSRRDDLPPVLALMISCIATVVIGGPGAIAFPIPALLWCGVAYKLFTTAILTLIFGVWTMIIIALSFPSEVSNPADEMALISTRLAISLLALAPIVLAIVTQNRNALLVKLHKLAMQDPLTGASNRNAFMEHAKHYLSQARGPVAVLMVDLDHFKSVNDTFGHAGGDDVLVAFVRRSSECLRTDDLLGRLGGEEFAILLPDCSQEQATNIAERIRSELGLPIVLSDGRVISVTASVGIAVVTKARGASIETLLADADGLLYCAKKNGRDRIEVAQRQPACSPSNADCSHPAQVL